MPTVFLLPAIRLEQKYFYSKMVLGNNYVDKKISILSMLFVSFRKFFALKGWRNSFI